MELLYEKEYISIWYDPRRIVIAVWHGYYTPEGIKDGTEMILHVLKNKKCIYAINDARQGKGTFLQAINWLEEYIFPNLVKEGLQKIAYVTSPDPDSRRSLERALEVNDQYEAQVFKDFDTAKKWVLGELDESGSPTIDLTDRWALRTKEKHVVLDFADILYIYPFDKGVNIHCAFETYHSKISLKQALEQLPEQFIQIHRSYIVNLHQVSGIKYHNSGSYHLFLKDLPKIKIPVSKKHVPTLKKLLNL